MRRFLYRIVQFMNGRYGHDNLNLFLLGLWLFLEIIWTISRFWVIGVLGILVIVIAIYRSLSKNIQKRMYENRKFMNIFNSLKRNINLLRRMWRDRDSYKYIKCPNCRAQLRVKKVKGEHRVHCPRCNRDFQKKI